MHELILLDFHWRELLQPQFYITHGGLWLLIFVIFAETGLFVGFFLPGDSLLFVTGIFAHEMNEQTHEPGIAHQFLKLVGMGEVSNVWLDLFMLIALFSIAGILGNMVGYWFGRRIGPAMYHWPDRLLFKKRYLHQAHEFYEKHGAGAIVAARFIPIIRTFAPIIAGIVQMDGKKFSFYNIVGSVAWIFSMIVGGYFLQRWVLTQFDFDLKQHLEIIVGQNPRTSLLQNPERLCKKNKLLF
jgi:membrane-associated protein